MAKESSFHGVWSGLISLGFAVVGGFLIIPNVLTIQKGMGHNTTSTIDIVVATSTQATSTVAFVLGSERPAATSDVIYAFDQTDHAFHTRPMPNGWRVTQWDTKPGSIEIKGDATFYKNSNGVETALRDAKGRAYANIQLLGQLDTAHVAFSGQLNDSVVFMVDRNGTITELYHTDSPINVLGSQGGLVYAATFQPGQGIELPPQGPSELFTINSAGKTTTLLRDDQLINGILVWGDHRLAYERDNGDMTIFASSTQTIARARPLVWADADHLIYSQGVNVFQQDLANGIATPLGSIASEPTIGRIGSP